jgi:hypothetical protein
VLNLVENHREFIIYRGINSCNSTAIISPGGIIVELSWWITTNQSESVQLGKRVHFPKNVMFAGLKRLKRAERPDGWAVGKCLRRPAQQSTLKEHFDGRKSQGALKTKVTNLDVYLIDL